MVDAVSWPMECLVVAARPGAGESVADLFRRVADSVEQLGSVDIMDMVLDVQEARVYFTFLEEQA